MSTESRFISDVELAEMLGIEVEDVRKGCREKGWPVVKPKRNVWRFTAEQVDRIVELQTVNKAKRAKKKDPAAGKIAGQTTRSARSRAS